MFINTALSGFEVVSPFGIVFHVPQGRKTKVKVAEGYWLVNHPNVEVEFESIEERAECDRLNEHAKLNPLQSLPKPQYLEPNATLQLDGYATRYPVIVVNPQGLLQEPHPEYHFGAKPMNLVLDKALIRQVVEEFHAALNAPYQEELGKSLVNGDESAETMEVELDVEMTDAELEALTNPDVPQDSLSAEEPLEEPAAPLADAPEATPAAKGKGAKRGAVKDEDI
jgi:hypothetical protein